MVGAENKATAAIPESPVTPYIPSTPKMDAPTPPLVGVYPSAESRNFSLKERSTRCATTCKPEEVQQKSLTRRNLRPFLGPLTDLLASPMPAPAVPAPHSRLLKYSDSSSSGSKPNASQPAGHGHTDSHTPQSEQSLQAKLTVQLTPIKAPSNLPPNEEHISVAVRLLSVKDEPDAEKPSADKMHACAAPHARQHEVQSSFGKYTPMGSCSTGSTAIWAAQPPGSVDMRGALRRPSSSPVSRSSTSKFPGPKMSPVRRFTYTSQLSALASPYSLERFQVSPIKPSPHSPPYEAPPQQRAYTPWAARSPYAGPQMPAAPQAPPRAGSSSFRDPCPQQPYPEYGCLSCAPGDFMSGPQREPVFAEYSMPPQEQVMPGMDQTGLAQQTSFFAHERKQQCMQQGAYVPQQHAPPPFEMPPGGMYGLQQPYMPPLSMHHTGEQPPQPQDMDLQWRAGPDCMAYERSPKARRRLARTWMGSPPYVKDLHRPDQAKARAAQEHLKAPIQAAEADIPASATNQGTGAFIPPAHTAKRTAAYVVPALRGERNCAPRISDPLTGKNLEEAAVLCHVLHSKGHGLHEVDRATVKDLVRQQIALGKPLFAPWYRDEHHDGTLREGCGSWHHSQNQNRPRFGARCMNCPF